MNYKVGKASNRVWMISLAFIICHLSCSLCSCSETSDEEVGEFANWQERNEAYFAGLEDSLSRAMASSLGTVYDRWKKIKTFAKDEATEGRSTDYIYVKVLDTGTSEQRPMYTDSVRVSYRGYLIPTKSYPEGYVFDQTYSGTFGWNTTGTSKGLVSGYVEGFTTALMHMHPGDRWRIFVPYQLGYKTSANGSVPAYSTLIFDLALIGISESGKAFPEWSARKAE